MTNDIKSVENKFINAMGSGASAAKHLETLIADANNTKDFRTLSNALTRLARANDKQGVTATRSIIGSVFVGAKTAKSKDGKSIVIKSKDAEYNREAYERLLGGVMSGLSLRATLAAVVKGGQDEEEKEFDLVAYAAKLVKGVDKKGVTKAALIAAIQAA